LELGGVSGKKEGRDWHRQLTAAVFHPIPKLVGKDRLSVVSSRLTDGKHDSWYSSRMPNSATSWSGPGRRLAEAGLAGADPRSEY
jgi:hypothetical protein